MTYVRVLPIKPSQAKVVSYYSDVVTDINSILNLSDSINGYVTLVDSYKLPMVLILKGPVQTNIVKRLIADYEAVGWTMSVKGEGQCDLFIRIDYKDLGNSI